MDLGLAGTAALVTGGSSGIGAAVARALVDEGVRVALCARRSEPLEVCARELRKRGGDVVALAGDTGVLADVERVVSAAAEEFAGLDILVNNAGATLFAPLEEISDERWLEDLNAKLLGYVRCTRVSIPFLERSDRACIVNVGGNAGRQPLPYHLPGGASNAGILNFTQSMGQYLGPRAIRVVGVAPGLVETPRLDKQLPVQAAQWGTTPEEARARMLRDIPTGRISSADDIANVVCFVASPRARQLNGTTITVDGGNTRGI
jgi:NAD(P)-dependent dehydrogenase (short-subunit alcohol dehydrogenase family)